MVETKLIYDETEEETEEVADYGGGHLIPHERAEI